MASHATPYAADTMPLSGHMCGVVKWAAFLDRVASVGRAAGAGFTSLSRAVTGHRDHIVVPVSTDARGVADLARRIRRHEVIEPSHAFRQAA
jgi:hypothetical protein